MSLSNHFEKWKGFNSDKSCFESSATREWVDQSYPQGFKVLKTWIVPKSLKVCNIFVQKNVQYELSLHVFANEAHVLLDTHC